VTGLIVTLGAGAIYAPTFALLGLASGLLFELGTFYALALGVAAGSVWGSYVGGLAGFLTVTPEMLIVSLLLWPLLVRLGSSSLVHERQNESAAAFLAVTVWFWPPSAILAEKIIITVIGVFVIIKHRSNIVRLLKGEENKIYIFKSSK
jgi:glycerol-3-phosphate acyltransferase PlsY